MAGYNNIDEIISAATVSGKVDSKHFYKYSAANTTNGTWSSLWQATGNPGAGATPATTPGTVYSRDAGSIEFDDRSPNLSFVAGLCAAGNIAGTLMFYDRLVAVSGISLASTGNKTISSSALTRYTTGKNVQAWVELTTASSATICSLSMNSYTNEGNTGSRAGGARVFTQAACTVGSMFRLPVQAPDRGTKAISTINVGTATTAAVCNVILMVPLARIPFQASNFNQRDFILQTTSLAQNYPNATIAMAFMSLTNNSAVTTWGKINCIYG